MKKPALVYFSKFWLSFHTPSTDHSGGACCTRESPNLGFVCPFRFSKHFFNFIYEVCLSDKKRGQVVHPASFLLSLRHQHRMRYH